MYRKALHYDRGIRKPTTTWESPSPMPDFQAGALVLAESREIDSTTAVAESARAASDLEDFLASQSGKTTTTQPSHRSVTIEKH